MCRSIKQLRGTEAPVTEEDIRAAARQYVRKVSGYRQPSKANNEVFERAIDEIAEATSRLLDDLIQRPRAANPPQS
jgi:hypothetical protein